MDLREDAWNTHTPLEGDLQLGPFPVPQTPRETHTGRDGTETGPGGAGWPRASRWHSQELLSRQLALEVPGAQVSLEFRWAQRHRLGLSPLETPGWDKNGVRTDTVP